MDSTEEIKRLYEKINSLMSLLEDRIQGLPSCGAECKCSPPTNAVYLVEEDGGIPTDLVIHWYCEECGGIRYL